MYTVTTIINKESSFTPFHFSMDPYSLETFGPFKSKSEAKEFTSEKIEKLKNSLDFDNDIKVKSEEKITLLIAKNYSSKTETEYYFVINKLKEK